VIVFYIGGSVGGLAAGVLWSEAGWPWSPFGGRPCDDGVDRYVRVVGAAGAKIQAPRDGAALALNAAASAYD
jgi:hypothetical protein